MRRLALSLLTVLCASLVLVGPAFASGQDVLNDYLGGPQGSGTIDACYTQEEFQEALEIARNDRAQYGNATQVIEDKMAECRDASAVTDTAEDEEAGMGIVFIVVVVLVVLALLIVGFVARSRQGKGGEFSGKEGEPKNPDDLEDLR